MVAVISTGGRYVWLVLAGWLAVCASACTNHPLVHRETDQTHRIRLLSQPAAVAPAVSDDDRDSDVNPRNVSGKDNTAASLMAPRNTSIPLVVAVIRIDRRPAPSSFISRAPPVVLLIA